MSLIGEAHPALGKHGILKLNSGSGLMGKAPDVGGEVPVLFF